MAAHGIRGKRRSIVHKSRGLGRREIILSVVHIRVKQRDRWRRGRVAVGPAAIPHPRPLSHIASAFSIVICATQKLG
jgi:hypothetical protein